MTSYMKYSFTYAYNYRYMKSRFWDFKLLFKSKYEQYYPV